MEEEAHPKGEKPGSGSVVSWPYRLKKITFFHEALVVKNHLPMKETQETRV